MLTFILLQKNIIKYYFEWLESFDENYVKCLIKY